MFDELIKKMVHAYWHSAGREESRMRAALSVAFPEIRDRCARAAMPCTAENPNENAYQRGRFDAVIEFQRSIRWLSLDGIAGEPVATIAKER